MKLRTIEIDFDVHKVIENARRGFEETRNSALRRLLGLPEAKSPPPSSTVAAPQHKTWIGHGVVLPHGTNVRMKYSGHEYEGLILDGLWVIGDRKFDTPSGAASGVGRTKKGTTTQLDGFKYWFVKRPGDAGWIFLENLRPKRTPPMTTTDEEGEGLDF